MEKLGYECKITVLLFNWIETFMFSNLFIPEKNI